MIGSFEIGFSSTGPEMEAMLVRVSFCLDICSEGSGPGARGWIGELLLDLINLLLGGLIAGVDLKGAGELGEGAVEVTTLTQDAALIDVGGGGLETNAREVGLVMYVVRLLSERLLVVLHGGVEVLMGFGGLSSLVPGFG